VLCCAARGHSGRHGPSTRRTAGVRVPPSTRQGFKSPQGGGAGGLDTGRGRRHWRRRHADSLQRFGSSPTTRLGSGGHAGITFRFAAAASPDVRQRGWMPTGCPFQAQITELRDVQTQRAAQRARDEEVPLPRSHPNDHRPTTTHSPATSASSTGDADIDRSTSPMPRPDLVRADSLVAPTNAPPATTRPASLTGRDPSAGRPCHTDGEQPPPATLTPSAAATERAPTTDDVAGPVLFTPSQAAALIKVPESWLRRRAAHRQIPCTMLGKHLRFSTANLEQIITGATRPARSAEPATESRAERSPDRPRTVPPAIRISTRRSGRSERSG